VTDVFGSDGDNSLLESIITPDGRLMVTVNGDVVGPHPFMFDWNETLGEWVYAGGLFDDDFSNAPSVSADGEWTAFGTVGSGVGADSVRVFRDEVEATITSTNPRGASATAFTSDGSYVAVGSHGGTSSTPRLTVHQRSGDTFTQNTPATQPTQTVFGLAFTPDGNVLLCADGSGNRILVYVKSGANFVWSHDIAVGSQPYGLAVSPDGTLLAVLLGVGVPCRLYSIAGSVFTALPTQPVFPTGVCVSGTVPVWSDDSQRFAYAHYLSVPGDNDYRTVVMDRGVGNTFTENASFAALVASGFPDMVGPVLFGSSSEQHEPATTVYVFTRGRTGQPGSWSRYLFPFRIEAQTFQLLGADLYFRHGDTINKFVPGVMYDEHAVDGDQTAFGGEVRWNYLDAGPTGATKHMLGFDFIGTGAPSFSVGFDERDPDLLTTAYAIDADTLPGGVIPYEVVAPSFSFKVDFEAGTSWSLKSVILYISPLRNGP
jgi:DNA-binding beta-propeller fold protein YncE